MFGFVCNVTSVLCRVKTYTNKSQFVDIIPLYHIGEHLEHPFEK